MHFETLNALWQNLSAGNFQQFGIWSYALLAVLVLVEGPIATLVGAVAASAGLMHPLWVFVAASAGNLSADMFWYSLGYAGEIDWLKKYGRWVGIRPAHITWLESEMQTHATKVLIIAKLTLSLALPALIAAGLARIPWRRSFGSVLLAEFIWTGGLVFAGYHFSRFAQQFERGVQIVAGGVMLVALFALIRYLKKHSPKLDEN